MKFPPNLLPLFQRYIAAISPGPTDLRNMRGTAGKRPQMRQLFEEFDLSCLRSAYEHSLEDLTERLCETFVGNWGAARKAVNLFVKDVVNHYALRAAYELDEIEPNLEIPLDSIVMRAIRRVSSDRSLVEIGVSALQPEISCAYQNAASGIAQNCGIARVHLDLIWWPAERQ
jgi:N-glycosylase/DNA lyase